MKIAYLEIVTPDVDATLESLSAASGLRFSEPEPMLGNARLAALEGGGQIGVRAPMRDTEAPVTRTYFASNDIEADTDAAVAAGAELAHPVLELPGICKFSIFIAGDNHFGFWES